MCSLLYLINDYYSTTETELPLLGINDEICVPVPNDNGVFPSAVWPLSPDNMEEECICPLCNSSHLGCDINTCHCINTTAYTVSIDKNSNLCFHNVTLEMNNTYVHIFFDLPSRCAGTCQHITFPPTINRLYVKSFRFQVGMYS